MSREFEKKSAFDAALTARSPTEFVTCVERGFAELEWIDASRLAPWRGRAEGVDETVRSVASALAEGAPAELWRVHQSWSSWCGTGTDWAAASLFAFEPELDSAGELSRAALPGGAFLLTRFEDLAAESRAWGTAYGLEWALSDEGSPTRRRRALGELSSTPSLRELARDPEAFAEIGRFMSTAGPLSTRVIATWLCRRDERGLLLAAPLPAGTLGASLRTKGERIEPSLPPARLDVSFLPPASALGRQHGSEADFFARVEVLGLGKPLEALGVADAGARISVATEAIAQARAEAAAEDLATLADGGGSRNVRSEPFSAQESSRVARALLEIATPRQAGVLVGKAFGALERVFGPEALGVLERSLGRKAHGHAWKPLVRGAELDGFPPLPEAAFLGATSGSFRAVRADGEVSPELAGAQLAARFAIGELRAGTLMWTTGLSEWKPVSAIPEAAALLSGASDPRWTVALPGGEAKEISLGEFARRVATGGFDSEIFVRERGGAWRLASQAPELNAVKDELERPRWAAFFGPRASSAPLSVRGLGRELALGADPATAKLWEAGSQRALSIAESPLASQVELWAAAAPALFLDSQIIAARVRLRHSESVLPEAQGALRS